MIVSCPHCNRRLKVEDAFAGLERSCPACQEAFTVPTLSAAPQTGIQNGAEPPAASGMGGVPESVAPSSAPPAAPGVFPSKDVGVESAGPARPPLATPAAPPSTSPPAIPPPVAPPGTGPTAQRGAPPVVPPPLPPSARTGAAAKAAPGRGPSGQPFPIRSQASPMSTQAALERVISSLSRALNLHMLGFYLVGAVVTIVVCALLVWVGGQIATEAGLAMLFIAAVVSFGMSVGVLPGGVAYLTHMQERGQAGRFGDAVAFCGRRFPSLFGGAILLLVLFALVPLIVNGVIALLNSGGDVGSAAGALLTLPQVLANLILVVAAAVAVILPCAIAVEDIGAMRALSRLAACVRRHTSTLMVQLALTVFFGGVVMQILVTLTGMAVVATLSTNCPKVLSTNELFDTSALSDLRSGLSSEWDRYLATPSSTRRRSRPAASSSQSGDSLRLFFLALVALAVIAYPVVYFIVSFTAYYEAIRVRVPQTGPPAQPSGP